MNQTALRSRKSNGSHPTADRTAPESIVHQQARAVDASFKAVARRILVHDDPASELPLRQFRVCAALFEGSRSMKELSQELGVSQSAVTQLADRLEAAGMVVRGAAGEDRRVRNLELTPRARKLLRRREEGRIERVQEILEQLAPPERSAVLRALELLRETAQGMDAPND